MKKFWSAAMLCGMLLSLGGASIDESGLRWSQADLYKINAIKGRLKKGDEISHRGKWYDLKLYEVSPSDAAMAIYVLDSLYPMFVNAIGRAPEGAVRTRILVFPSLDVYNSVTPMKNTGGVCTYSGFGKNLNITLMTYCEPYQFERCRQTLVHESVHSLVAQLFLEKRSIPIPIWLNEGLATYFEGWNIFSTAKPRGFRNFDRNEKKNRRRSTLLVKKLRYYFRKEDPAPNMEYLLKMTPQEFQSGNVHFHYALVESFLDFLLSSSDGTACFDFVMDSLLGRRPNVPAAAKDPKIDEKWIKFLKGLLLNQIHY